jgi:hypothetical protein
VPRTPTDPTSTGVTLRADVASSSELEATYWFDYGKTTAYGSATPKRTVVLNSHAQAVSEPVTGLQPDTTYHYRACASDPEEDPPRVNCSGDATFATVGDSVSGSGSVHFPTGTPPGRIVAEIDFVDVRSGSAGQNPGGILRMYVDEGPRDYEVTCLRVDGTRFTVGTRLANAPDEQRAFRFFDVTGSGYGTARSESVGGRDPWSCPDPASGLPGDYNFVRGSNFALRDAP